MLHFEAAVRIWGDLRYRVEVSVVSQELFCKYRWSVRIED